MVCWSLAKRYILAPYLFILHLDYMLRTSIDLIKENGFTFKKKAKSMTDADYTDDLRLLLQAVGGIGLYGNINKTECMRFKQKGVISGLSGKPPKLVDQLTYLNSTISSTESDVNICLAKAWNAMLCYIYI